MISIFTWLFIILLILGFIGACTALIILIAIFSDISNYISDYLWKKHYKK